MVCLYVFLIADALVALVSQGFEWQKIELVEEWVFSIDSGFVDTSTIAPPP